MENAALVGLCLRCRHHRQVPSGRGSVFHRCLLSERDPRFPRYPRLPVHTCSGFTPASADASGSDPDPQPDPGSDASREPE